MSDNTLMLLESERDSARPFVVPWYDLLRRVINELPFDFMFKPLRRPTAEFASWLAWQERPGEGLYNTLEAGLLDNQSLLHSNCVDG